MSSPIHRAKDRDAALRYAPRWARDPGPGIAAAAPQMKWPVPSQRVSNGQGFSGDLAMTELQRQLALDPRKAPQPPRAEAGGHFVGKIALRMGGVAAAAALVGWGMMSITGARLLRNDTAQASFVSSPNTIDRSARDSGGAAGKRPIKTGQATMREPSPARVARQENTGAVPPMAAPAPPSPQFTPAPQSAPPAPQPALAREQSDSDNTKLDPQEIAMLVSRGEDYLTNGDLASARLLLRRAAAAGSANAALALGATFDPLVIRRLGAIGAEPDIARARKWYQKAIELGSTAASRQLATLAQLPQ
jgi:hypothetical protein